MHKDPITLAGYQALQEEHKRLIRFDRPTIIEAIDTARAHGDLKENAEYHAAREKQSFIEGRIERLNHLLANCEVIDIAKMGGPQIRFGATVTYRDLDTEDETTWIIVGEEEADIKQRKISVKSPIAKSLLGKEEGDEVTLRVPKGNVEVEILSVKWG
ncbi:MAG: transcription elongation factor GreA [Candidatus Lambdaproteobacteria bacterium RIFOXYD2_FULL_50_16]|uniref:Transcription elongation factor GreA n=1 Tax=Candidatus Lambdaproteobacteria bacterium RIFOXYD2_FULL_50_16 TaxID=1817772 RepID=A0A1F6GF10_9PROT|nr:MAG: transcription elongation factor GreA [Candidatus Lambdaproteobacteria bacterium RIFOXYD2_FULL_50_16]